MKTSSLQVSTTTQYSIQETDNSYIVRVVQSQYKPNRRVGFSTPWFLIVLIVIVIVASVISSVVIPSDSKVQASAPSVCTSVPATGNNTDDSAFCPSLISRWKDSGFLFPDSDTRYLTEDDIISLAQAEGYSEAELLRYAVNEIYARHHYLFTTEKYANFFNAYDWYDGYLSADDACALFNSIEHRNIATLLKAEEKYE